MRVNRECFSYIIDFFVGDSLDVKLDEFGDVADNEGGVNNPDNWLLRNPLLHGSHRNSMDFIPEVYLLVQEVVVPDESAFVFEFIW